MIYITANSKKGIFWKRFHALGLKKKDVLIILGDTGLRQEEGYEGIYRRDWFETQPYSIFVIPKNDTMELDCQKNIKYLCGDKLYVIGGQRFLVINESSSSENLTGMEVDYALVTNYEIFTTIKNRIKYKHAYIGEGESTVQQECGITFLKEAIIRIK